MPELRSLNEISHRHDDPETVLAVLDRINLLKLPVSDSLGISAQEKVSRLSAAGIGFSVAQVDDALSKTKLSITDRLTLKAAMVRHGLMRRAA